MAYKIQKVHPDAAAVSCIMLVPSHWTWGPKNLKHECHSPRGACKLPSLNHEQAPVLGNSAGQHVLRKSTFKASYSGPFFQSLAGASLPQSLEELDANRKRCWSASQTALYMFLYAASRYAVVMEACLFLWRRWMQKGRAAGLQVRLAFKEFHML